MTALAFVLLSLPILLAVYAYAVYPLLLWLVARGQKGEAQARPSASPLVSIVIPAYNEEAQIRGAIESLLAQDYPRNRRQILILSDASTDRTDSIVGEYADQGVELLRLPVRGGKTAAENASLAHIRGDIVINSDASIRLNPEAVSRLAAAMADPTVGVASTRDVSVGSHGENQAEAGYVGYEMRIRALETLAGGIVGASGSGYAIRSELHRRPVRADLSRDFSAALSAERFGFRAVAVEDAVCYVPRTASPSAEYRRKVRTIARGMETLFFNRDLVDPMRHGLFAWKLISHKICRWLVPIAAIPAAIGLLILSVQGERWSLVLLAAGVAGLVLAMLRARRDDAGSLGFVPPSVLGALAANLAVVHATWRFFHGHEDHIWEPTRRPNPA